MRIEYPISIEYVKNWGIWEAVREFLQNALDTKDYQIKYDQGYLCITNTGSLNRSMLLLGKSIKDKGSRGQFGEGMKLAMLVFARMKRRVAIYTGKERWHPYIGDSKIFNEKVFCVSVDKYNRDRVLVEIEITSSEWAEIQSKTLDEPNRHGILKDRRAGLVFVGGLYVCTLKGFEYAYNFSPDVIQLNRDRDIPSMFDVQLAATGCLTDSQFLELAVSGKADASEYAYRAQGLSAAFRASYGGYTPIGISEQGKVKADKIKVVPDWVARMIRSVGGWFVKHTDSPIERLEKFRKEQCWVCSHAAELQIIIEELKGE